MWMLMAIVCTDPSATSCDTLTWEKENFMSLKQCAEVALRETPALAERYAWVVPKCLEVPGITSS